MYIFIRSLTGKVTTLDVISSDTIYNIKKMYQDKEAVPAERQALIYSGKELKDENTLSDCNISSETTITMVQLLPGC